ncbi:hypothetical protein AMS68_005422 [Peltaster fructicola]|uniref:Anaphase-promoting complex subunit 4 WD40 domain-containing protein n=1 Tax=Peltaster fructicola TaxID=286661 RepID=A0A6H0XZ11_9PEZI|nr:hypothetical protein AMS68_005422 [Peltaster fructicola]
MNTRNAIQSSDQDTVLSIGWSHSRRRFAVGLSEGCRVFRADNCLTTHHPRLATDEKAIADGGVGVASVFDDRYLAFAKGGRTPQGSPHIFVFWDATLGKQISVFDLHEPIVSIKLGSAFAAIVLKERTILLQYQQLIPLDGTISERQPTGGNEISKTIVVVPAQSTGQIQIIPFPSGSKRVFRAHNTALRALALSDDSSLIATASIQGTLVRVFDTMTLDQIAEFRRGVDSSIVYSLAISRGNRWVACTSDKGTLHVFDLRPSSQAPVEPQRPLPHRKSVSQGQAPSNASVARSSPPGSVQYQGSIQEYYGLLPAPSIATPASHTAATSALNAFKHSAFAPRALKDIRSVASGPFYIGNESQHWQGGAAYSWTTGPDGTRRRVRNPVPPLANDPSGRPPKGVLAFAAEEMDDNDGALMYVIGGGNDARWERFRLVRGNAGSNGWMLVNEGFRRYLTRQFAD